MGVLHRIPGDLMRALGQLAARLYGDRQRPQALGARLALTDTSAWHSRQFCT